MGEKITRILDCEEKEPDFDDSDEEFDEKLSNTSNKTSDKTMNLVNIEKSNMNSPNPPPNTAKEICNKFKLMNL